jgi:hypothetical protein
MGGQRLANRREALFAFVLLALSSSRAQRNPPRGRGLRDAHRHREGFCRRHRRTAEEICDDQGWAFRGFHEFVPASEENEGLAYPGH